MHSDPHYNPSTVLPEKINLETLQIRHSYWPEILLMNTKYITNIEWEQYLIFNYFTLLGWSLEILRSILKIKYIRPLICCTCSSC